MHAVGHGVSRKQQQYRTCKEDMPEKKWERRRHKKSITLQANCQW
jgi:hypothetical protein